MIKALLASHSSPSTPGELHALVELIRLADEYAVGLNACSIYSV